MLKFINEVYMQKFSVIIFQALIFSITSFAQSTESIAGKWAGTETVVCLDQHNGTWSTKVNLTKVTFTPDPGSKGQYGTYTATPAFFGLPERYGSSTERCTVTPTGVATGKYFISGTSGQLIASGRCEEGSCGLSWDYFLSLSNGKMKVSNGTFTYELSKGDVEY